MSKYFSKVAGIVGYVIQYSCWTHCTFEYIGDFVICSGPSMEPTLHSNNILITDRISPRMHLIDRGDIIIAKNPINPAQHICKRVIGLPGDKIITKTSFHMNPFVERKLNKSESIEQDDHNTVAEATDQLSLADKIFKSNVVIVPRGHVWIEGDNTDNSSDSRYYGPIPEGLIKSKAICRVWPLVDFKVF